MGEMERRRREDPEIHKGAGTGAYVTTAVGIGLIIAAVLIIITSGTAAAGFPFVIGAMACLGIGISRFAREQRSMPAAVSGERELLSAIRENGGSITPAEAAMETTLTVREADRMLSELASEGHLMVEGHEGSLYYALPRRADQQLEGR